MTVIAYRNGILAADAMVSEGNTGTKAITNKLGLKVKGNKVIAVGTSGDSPEAIALEKFVLNGCRDKDMQKTREFLGGKFVRGLIVRFDKVLAFTEMNVSLLEDSYLDEYYAIGSGASAAMGAMFTGASAIEAVRAACSTCIYCGYPIFYVDVTRGKHAKIEKISQA